MIMFSQNSLVLLKKCLEIHNPSLLHAINVKDTNKFDEEFLNELRDAVCDELLLNGFEGVSPSKCGLELERLIDEIGGLFM